MKYRTQELVYIAVFGTIWGVVEMTLGSYLHVLNVPQAGTVLAAVGWSWGGRLCRGGARRC